MLVSSLYNDKAPVQFGDDANIEIKRIGMRPRLVYLLFLFSGLAGLIYEIVWGRLLMLIFGNTTQSMVAVITAFLGGLGLGSFIAGRFSDRFGAKRLIQIYALLEIGVGLTAAATLLLLPL